MSQLQPFDGPLFKKLIALVEHYIDQGILVAEERLPSERELAIKLKINRSTVVRALEQLTERNILVRKPGSGTFVNAKKWGVQTYPTINWHLPSQFNKSLSLYQQKIIQLKQLGTTRNWCDLANGDLPAAFMPQLNLPEMSSQELIYQETSTELMQLGLPSLKLSITSYMRQQFGMSVNPAEILITSGTQQALFLITQGLLKPGDAIGVEAPSYFYSLALFQAAGVRIYAIDMDKQGIMVASLQAVHEKYHLKWLFLNPVFQNPTGITMSPARKQSVLQFCRQACVGIVEDDAYSALYFDQSVDCCPIKRSDLDNQVIYLGSLSKYIGKHIRIGWMIAPVAIIRRLAEIRHYIDSGLSILPQLLAQDYLQHHYLAHQHYLRRQLQAKRDRLIKWLEANYAGSLCYQRPLGGFHLYAQLAVTNPKQESEFLNSLLSQSIMVMKGENFGDSYGHIRLSYGHFNLSECA